MRRLRAVTHTLTTNCRHTLGTKVCMSLQVWTVGLFLSSTQTFLQETLCWWLGKVLDREEKKSRFKLFFVKTRTRVCVDFGLFLEILNNEH